MLYAPFLMAHGVQSLHFATDTMGLSSFKFFCWAP